jgi:citrate synthase
VELTTQQVAAVLGVKPETVYAYVSRGHLRSTRGTGGRGSRFDADEVAAFAARTAAARPATGVVESLTTGLTQLTEDDDLGYRGHRVTELAGTRDLAAVASLLWRGDLDAGVSFGLPDAPLDHLRAVLDGLGPAPRLTDRLRVAAALLAPTDPWRFDLSPDAVVRTGARLVGGLAALLSPPGRPAAGPAELLWPALTAAPPQPSVLETVLVLLADHGLAASTLTARTAASARAHPYAVVSAGLGALDGPVHGTASTAAHRFLADALVDPDAAIAERLRAGESLPGFGHRVYRTRDPRAEVVLDLVAGSEVRAVVDELAARVADRPGMFPNVDLALAALVHAHGMRPDAGEALFALARTVGWIAHALEEYAEPGLRFRVEGVYTGPPLGG